MKRIIEKIKLALLIIDTWVKASGWRMMSNAIIIIAFIWPVLGLIAADICAVIITQGMVIYDEHRHPEKVAAWHDAVCALIGIILINLVIGLALWLKLV